MNINKNEKNYSLNHHKEKKNFSTTIEISFRIIIWRTQIRGIKNKIWTVNTFDNRFDTMVVNSLIVNALLHYDLRIVHSFGWSSKAWIHLYISTSVMDNNFIYEITAIWRYRKREYNYLDVKSQGQLRNFLILRLWKSTNWQKLSGTYAYVNIDNWYNVGVLIKC